MLIEASAPTRIDLAGGTLDIWPLYLFHEGAQTLNAAISPRARCSVRSRNDRHIVIIGAHGGKVCGAGGGGCLFCIGDPADVPAIRRALADGGARVLEFEVEREGLRIESRDAASVG